MVFLSSHVRLQPSIGPPQACSSTDSRALLSCDAVRVSVAKVPNTAVVQMQNRARVATSMRSLWEHNPAHLGPLHADMRQVAPEMLIPRANSLGCFIVTVRDALVGKNMGALGEFGDELQNLSSSNCKETFLPACGQHCTRQLSRGWIGI